MHHIVLYLGDGTYSGKGEYELRPPEIGARHEFILFLRQSNAEPAFSIATEEAGRFGFLEVTLKQAREIQTESLNTMRGFSGYYEEALSAGRSLVWYTHENASV